MTVSCTTIPNQCLSLFDQDGNELSFVSTEVGNQGIRNAVRLGDGYLVQLFHGSEERLAKLDSDGNLTESVAYSGEDCVYYIQDMVEFGDRVYISAYAVPGQTDGTDRYEVADVLDYVCSSGSDGTINLDISSEELTPLLRENYTAVLLACDALDGTPESLCLVKGSLGGALEVDNGQLRWDVDSLTASLYSIATSSFTFAGTCQVYRYTFDNEGVLLGQENTGENVQYRR